MLAHVTTVRRRRQSLLLLFTPSLLLVAAPVLVLAASGQTPGAQLAPMLGLVAVLPPATPLLLRLVGRSWDPYLLAPAWVLCALGLAVIARVQPGLVTTQLLWISAGWAAFITLAGFPLLLPWLRSLRYWLLGAALVLVLVTLAFGEDVTGQGARLWLTVGPFRMQPAELLRVVLVAFVAGHLAQRVRDAGGRGTVMSSLWDDWLPLLGMVGLAVLAVLAQRDFGPSLIFGTSFVAMLYLATGRRRYVAAAALVAAVGFALVYLGSDRVQGRVDIWLDPWSDPRGQGYQALQALGGFVFGGVFGAGPGYGYPGLIPAAHTDYPLAVIGEEWGLLGSLAVVALYALITTHALARASLARDGFGQLLSAGLAVSLAAQVVLVFGGILRLLPLTGLTSPFLSYGGSSMLMAWVMLALLTSAQGPTAAPDGDERADPFPLRGEVLGDRARVLGLAMLGAFAVLGATLGYWHAGRTDLVTHPAVVGERLRSEEARIQRGRILDRDGDVLAVTEIGPDGEPRRVYTSSGAVHVLGFTSTRVGATGVESAAADRLMGRTSPSPRDTWLDLLHEARAGEDVRLTIDLDVQRAAEAGLAGTAGAVVALDPVTGQVLAMASSPGFDPGFSPEEWDALREAEGSPLLNRATQGLYTPGSTFKTVTLAAALEYGLVTPETPASCPPEVFIDGVRIVSYNEPPGRQTATVADAYAYSCNTYFAQLGVQVGADRLRAMAEALGLTEAPPFPLPAAQGRLYTSDGFLETGAGLAASSFGQGELQFSPLHLALVTAAAAHEGLVPVPRLFLDEAPETWRTALSPGAAQQLAAVMVRSVEAGWASTASVPGVEVGGKTGSAEVVVEENPHALFVAFGRVNGHQLAVAVIKEHGGSGSQEAGPVARAVLEAWHASLR